MLVEIWVYRGYFAKHHDAYKKMSVLSAGYKICPTYNKLEIS